MQHLRRYGSTDPIFFFLWNPDGTALVSGATIDAGDLQISKDGAAFANVTGTFAEVGAGLYRYTPAGADLQCKVAALKWVDGEGVALDKPIIIETYGHPSAQHPDIGVAMPNTGVAQAGAAGSITLATSASSTNDIYSGMTVYIISGTGAGQARFISDYVGSTRVASVDPNWTVTPDNTSVYVLLPSPPAPAASANLPAVNTAAWAGVATSSNDIAIKQTLEKTTHITGFNDLSAAEVNAEVDAALQDIHLHRLFAADYDPAAKPGVATALLNELVENDGGVSRFTANALEQAPTGGGASAETVAEAVLEKVVADHDDVPGSLAAVIAAISSKTTALPADPASQSALLTRLGTPAGASIAADIAGVKSDTAAILDDTGTSSVVVAASSKSGYSLAATGLDLVAGSEPSSVPNFAASILAKINFMFALMRNEIRNNGTTQTLRNNANTADIATANVGEADGVVTRGGWT